MKKISFNSDTLDVHIEKLTITKITDQKIYFSNKTNIPIDYVNRLVASRNIFKVIRDNSSKISDDQYIMLLIKQSIVNNLSFLKSKTNKILSYLTKEVNEISSLIQKIENIKSLKESRVNNVNDY